MTGGRTMARTFVILLGVAMVTCWLSASEAVRHGLPRFTEEREAAAVYFVKKHLPELLPLLDELRKNQQSRYQQEIREIFQVSEMLADLQDEPRRYELELKVWKASNKAHILVGRMSTPNIEDRKRAEEQLRELARELCDLDIQILEQHAEMLEKELAEVKEELTRAREHIEQNV